MASTQTAALLDVVSLLQAPAEENVEAPIFVTSSPGMVHLTKKLQTRSTLSSAPATPKDEPEEDDLKTQYFQAIQLASQLPKKTRLETFNPFHQKCASHLINVFYKIPLNDLGRAVKYAQTQINIPLLNYALSVALLHRDDAADANLQLPSHANTDPGMYFDIEKVKSDIDGKEFTLVNDGKMQKQFVEMNLNYTATNKDPEHKVAYFREDIGLNLHHRHWHEVYPFDADKVIVDKDRRGELFYYMHQQIVARYNFERFSNGLPRAEPYEDFRQPIKEAYFPKLDSLSTSSKFTSRTANSVLKDLQRDYFFVKVTTLERWRERIFDAIDRGYAYTIDPETKEEKLKKIDPVTGIDELGNSVEAVEKLSWHYQYYGDLHNKGHLFFSYVHDPDSRFREDGSVMSHSETALRDPIFYRWHVFIDDIFQHYKKTLPPYSLKELSPPNVASLLQSSLNRVYLKYNLQRQFEGININSVKILPQEITSVDNTDGNEDEHANRSRNVIKTFFEKDAVDITNGLLNTDKDKIQKEIYAVFTHLQHKEFEYEITVSSDLSETVTGTVRIFMAPHFDESGQPMSFNLQRRMFIEMDKFIAQIDAGTTTVIKRKSTESSVTIPFEKSFMTMKDVQKLAEPQTNKKLIDAINGYCSCGWPQHLLVGKGTTGQGMLCDLFVMITNYAEDKVEESPLEQKCCDKSSLSYCGVRNRKYPDKRPMGFPFDRYIPNVKATVRDFITEEQTDYEQQNPNDYYKNGPARLPNMIVVPVRVRHQTGPPKSGNSLIGSGYVDETSNKESR